MCRILSVQFSELWQLYPSMYHYSKQDVEHLHSPRNFPYVNTYFSAAGPRIRSFHSVCFLITLVRCSRKLTLVSIN